MCVIVCFVFLGGFVWVFCFEPTLLLCVCYVADRACFLCACFLLVFNVMLFVFVRVCASVLRDACLCACC